MITNSLSRPCCCPSGREISKKAELDENRKKAGSEYAAALAALHSGSVPAAKSAFEQLQKHVEPSDPLRPAVDQLAIAVQERQDCLAHRRKVAAYARVQASLHQLHSSVEVSA
ncbi:hypothetical protein JST97_32220 [bacterium]|nr:hypothetical protein [bacterium]